MKPGKPLSVASLSRPQAPSIPLFGLPGNPVSCVVSYLLFIHPLLQRASGTPQGEWGLRRLTCTLAEPISKRHQRAEFFRVRLSRAEQARSSGISSWLCELAGGQSSGWISSIASGDALLETPAEPIEWPLGHQVEVSLFPWWSG
jgi:gephyrin